MYKEFRKVKKIKILQELFLITYCIFLDRKLLKKVVKN